MLRIYSILVTIIAVIALSLCLCDSCNKRTNTIVKTEYVSDTTYTFLLDTIIQKELQCKNVIIRDTIQIYKDTALYIVQKEYDSDSLYHVWVSGIEPVNLDSIYVYPRTEYITINSIEKQYVESNKAKYFVSASLNGFSRTFKPSVGIYTIQRGKWLYGAEIGLNQDNKVSYSLKLGYRIK